MNKNHLRGVERVRRCQNRGSLTPRDKRQGDLFYCCRGIRRINGVILSQAPARNARTCRADAKGEPQAIHTASGSVPMRRTGAEYPVLVTKSPERGKERRGYVIYVLINAETARRRVKQEVQDD